MPKNAAASANQSAKGDTLHEMKGTSFPFSDKNGKNACFLAQIRLKSTHF